MPLALDHDLSIRDIREDASRSLGLVWLKKMPETSIYLKIFPFVLVRSGDRMTCITAKGNAMLVIRGAFIAAIMSGYRRVEILVKRGKIFRVRRGHVERIPHKQGINSIGLSRL